jgi:hypothetical protein
MMPQKNLGIKGLETIPKGIGFLGFSWLQVGHTLNLKIKIHAVNFIYLKY